jgi:cytochrome c biogenesis protein CcmG/thiol:disulfide interchange protein DsbE
VKQRTDWISMMLIAVLAIGLVYVVSGTLEPPLVNAGDKAPDFKVTTEHGKTITRDNFGGKLLVLNFWASWCPPCVEETPSLEEFAKEFAPQGVVVLGVSNDGSDSQYKNFLQRYHIDFETARDTQNAISASYGTYQLPETYLIDQKGRVVEKIISNQNWMDPEFLARVRKLL